MGSWAICFPEGIGICKCTCVNVCQSARKKKLDLINTQKYMQHAHAFDI